MSNMMAGLQLSVFADSQYGASLSGFHCTTLEFPAKLEELRRAFSFTEFQMAETNGYVLFLAYRSEIRRVDSLQYGVATLRREPHRFFADLPSFLRKTRACAIACATLTESLGSFTLTIGYYYDAPIPPSNVNG